MTHTVSLSARLADLEGKFAAVPGARDSLALLDQAIAEMHLQRAAYVQVINEGEAAGQLVARTREAFEAILAGPPTPEEVEAAFQYIEDLHAGRVPEIPVDDQGPPRDPPVDDSANRVAESGPPADDVPDANIEPSGPDDQSGAPEVQQSAPPHDVARSERTHGNRIMDLLAEHPGLTGAEIAGALGIPKSSVQPTLSALKAKGRIVGEGFPAQFFVPPSSTPVQSGAPSEPENTVPDANALRDSKPVDVQAVKQTAPIPGAPLHDLDEAAQQVHQILSGFPTGASETLISGRARGLKGHQIRAALGSLEFEGHARHEGGRWHVVKVERQAADD